MALVVHRRVVHAAVVAGLAAVLTGCGGGSPSAASTTKAPTTSAAASTTIPATTTTTVGIPPAPQPSDEDAAEALISAWAANSQGRALEVATPAAVASLFATAYPPGNAIPRGCSVSFPPLICTFGAPGGGNPNAPLIEVYVTQTTAGWYVSSVDVET